jgi:cell division protein FtsL
VPAAAPVVRAPAVAPPPEARPGPRHARPHLQVVAPPKPAYQLRTGPTVALGCVLAFVIAIAVVACQVLLVQGQQRLDAVHGEIAEQTDRYDELRLEVAELESPERIVAAATELGMVPPPEVTYLTPSGAVTLPAGASAPGIDAASPDRLADHAATRPNLEGGG